MTDSSGSDKLKLDIYWCRCLLEHHFDCNFVLCHVVNFLYLGVYQLAAMALHIRVIFLRRSLNIFSLDNLVRKYGTFSNLVAQLSVLNS